MKLSEQLEDQEKYNFSCVHLGPLLVPVLTITRAMIVKVPLSNVKMYLFPKSSTFANNQTEGQYSIERGKVPGGEAGRVCMIP